jgi:hypothetical protein
LTGVESTTSSRIAACSAYGYLLTCVVPGESLDCGSARSGSWRLCAPSSRSIAHLLSAWCGVVSGSSARMTICRALSNREVSWRQVVSASSKQRRCWERDLRCEQNLSGRCERAAKPLPALHPMSHRARTLTGVESTTSSRIAACSAYGYLLTCVVPGESLDR